MKNNFEYKAGHFSMPCRVCAYKELPYDCERCADCVFCNKNVDTTTWVLDEGDKLVEQYRKENKDRLLADANDRLER